LCPFALALSSSLHDPATTKIYTLSLHDALPISFMDKEIHDQPHAVADTLLGRTDPSGKLVLDDLRIDEAVLRSVDKIIVVACGTDRKSTRLNSSHVKISYAVFCLKKKTKA